MTTPQHMRNNNCLFLYWPFVWCHFFLVRYNTERLKLLYLKSMVISYWIKNFIRGRNLPLKCTEFVVDIRTNVTLNMLSTAWCDKLYNVNWFDSHWCSPIALNKTAVLKPNLIFIFTKWIPALTARSAKMMFLYTTERG